MAPPPVPASGWLLLWHCAAMVLVLTMPARWQLGAPLRELPPLQQIQSWVWAVAYLIVALAFAVYARSGARRFWIPPLLAAIVCAAAYLLLRFVLAVPFSHRVVLVSVILIAVLAILPGLIGRLVTAGAMVLAAGAIALAIGGLRPAPEALHRTIATAVHNIAVREYRSVVDSVQIQGGALAAVAGGFLLVTGEGEFYRLELAPDSGLTSRRLPLTAWLNSDSLRSARDEVRAMGGGGFALRTLDIAVDTAARPDRVYLAQNYWHHANRCLTVRLVVADVPEAGGAERADAWRTLLETAPCVPPSYDLRHGGLGARLAWVDRSTLLMTIGDHGLMGPDGMAGAQNRSHPYGKVLRVDTSGRHTIFSMGLRNPQGLSIGPDGLAWSTDHGPQGGDELNQLVMGANYGWPLATYGVQYGQERWPLGPGGRDHGAFAEPALAFVPSLGTSNLIHLDSVGFPYWAGDLLVSSMRANTMVRVRTRGDRVVYSERFPIGYRIRDLEQGPDGRVLLWTDAGWILVLANQPRVTKGARAYAACASCHGAELEGTPLGPPLQGVVDRPVASLSDYDYSPALRRLGGRWTPERLGAFLAAPEQVVPGTTMSFPGIESDSTRRWLIEYLRNP